MRKILLCLSALCLTSCTVFTKEPNKIEEIETDAKLHIIMEDKVLGDILEKQWVKLYPEQKDQLTIDLKPSKFTQTLEGDIVWANDSNIPYLKDQAMAIDDVHWYKDFAPPTNTLTSAYFLPFIGSGSVFVINDNIRKVKHLSEEFFISFEEIGKLASNTYYHTRDIDHVYPFMFSHYEIPSPLTLETLFQGEAFRLQLEQYKNLYYATNLNDDPFSIDTFYEEDYVCGLVKINQKLFESEAYKQGNLHFTKMPTYQEKQLTPLVETQGFMIQKDTKYPKACIAFLKMTRSKPVMQALLDKTMMTPLINTEDIEQLNLFDHQRKEIIDAFNYSSPKVDRILVDKPSITWENIYRNSDFLSMLQNYMYSKDNVVTQQKKMIEQITTWIYNQ